MICSHCKEVVNKAQIMSTRGKEIFCANCVFDENEILPKKWRPTSWDERGSVPPENW